MIPVESTIHTPTPMHSRPKTSRDWPGTMPRVASIRTPISSTMVSAARPDKKRAATMMRMLMEMATITSPVSAAVAAASAEKNPDQAEGS